MIGSLTAALPVVLWVELTSRCPFDCVFCYRRSDRGAGEHMDFGLFRSLLAQLREPEIIRLNYAGESIHYPHLAEAIRLARETGAVTELVSAFASVTDETLRGIVDAGLHRLTISLHTLDPVQYGEIYRFGSLERLQRRIEELQEYKRACGTPFPYLDFAFVAMDSNRRQLPEVTEYARRLGVPNVSVIPVIRRADIPPDPHLAGLTTCEQNPWETAHVLSNGDVVACEVCDKAPLGNLSTQSLEEIWTGSAYREFRSGYVDGTRIECGECLWRQTVPLERATEPFHVRGWHPAAPGEAVWSRQHAAFAIRIPPAARLHVTGANSATVSVDGRVVAEATNDSGAIQEVRIAIPFELREPSVKVLSIGAARRCCPAMEGTGPDLRQLGFALTGVEFEASESRRARVDFVLSTLARIDAACSRLPRVRLREGSPTRKGISIVIPERGNPELLDRCLGSIAASKLDEPIETIVAVNGSPRSDYAALEHEHASTRFLFHTQPLGFSEAILRGVERARFDWTYLLNNDMELTPDTLFQAAALRAPGVFAIASRIEMQDTTLSNVETNWTGYRYEGGAVTLIERDPGSDFTPRESLYAGGGSALFQTRMLARLARRTRAYAPFYWEDVEWGVVAWRSGFRTLFCPASRGRHAYRRTVSQFYAPEEVDRVFQRNGLLFQLRLLDVEDLRTRLLELDEVTFGELFSRKAMASLFRARIRTARLQFGEEALRAPCGM